MARQMYHFVAGEQHLQFASITVLDAWMKVELYAKRNPVASEFRQLPIAGYDEAGTELATRSWDDWHIAVLKDTYGDGYAELISHATELL